MKNYFVYIVTNKNNSVIYVGITNNLDRRSSEHKLKNSSKSFTAKYNLNKLVYFELFNDIGYAIDREKQIKGGSRKRKISLINSMNPNWDDLSELR